MKLSNISISDNRVAIDLENGEEVKFVVWDLEESQHDDLILQLKAAFSICSSFDEIENHLKLNGFDASLEEIIPLAK